MNKKTDHQWEIEKLKEIKQLDHKPRLLMHSCCAVCNSWPLEYLYDTFDITLYYNNSNIYPQTEYDHRLLELHRYVDLFNQKHNSTITIIEEPYDYERYKSTYLVKRAQDKEGYQRCGMCYALRITEALKFASIHNFDYVTTVMTISRQKSADKINGIARRLATGYPQVQYFYSNFKKNRGIDFSVDVSKSLGMYRQEYCGCEYSTDNLQDE
jgi:predicted adenine nucleotide alpha hydrolase (AANH) superfamily ATPase